MIPPHLHFALFITFLTLFLKLLDLEEIRFITFLTLFLKLLDLEEIRFTFRSLYPKVETFRLPLDMMRLGLGGLSLSEPAVG
jgi:hypothetical protein